MKLQYLYNFNPKFITKTVQNHLRYSSLQTFQVDSQCRYQNRNRRCEDVEKIVLLCFAALQAVNLSVFGSHHAWVVRKRDS